MYVPIPKGTEPWDAQVNGAFTDQDSRITALENAPTRGNYYWLVASATASAEVKAAADFVCIGVNDEAQINAALMAAYGNSGGVVQLSAGKFSTAAPLMVPPGVGLYGVHGEDINNPGQCEVQSIIEPSGAFLGSSVIFMPDQATGGYSALSCEQQVFRLTIDGALAPPGTHGIESTGYVHGVILDNVCLKRIPGKGIYTHGSAPRPFSWVFNRVVVDDAGEEGIYIVGMSDAHLTNTTAISSIGDNFRFENMPNSRAFGLRAEWSGSGNGYHITGAWGNGAGSGGMTMVGCTTDRNFANGYLIDSTGNAPIMIQDTQVRRDGRNNGTGGGDYAGINVSAATNPVILSSITCYPGVDDGGGATNSPQYGLRMTGSTYVSLNSGFLHAQDAGWSDGGGNTTLRRGPNIGERTGSTTSPVNAFAQPWATAGNTTMAGYTTIDSGQVNGTWTSFSTARNALRAGNAGGGLAIAEGANGRSGLATLAAGTVTLANTSISANTRIQLTHQTVGGIIGILSSVKNAGVGFTINSSNAADTSTVAYLLIEPS